MKRLVVPLNKYGYKIIKTTGVSHDMDIYKAARYF